MASGLSQEETTSMTTCPDCRGVIFEEGCFEIAQLHQGSPALIRNVPAARCVQCGYMVIKASVLRQIERALSTGRVTSFVRARVYDLADKSDMGSNTRLMIGVEPEIVAGASLVATATATTRVPVMVTPAA